MAVGLLAALALAAPSGAVHAQGWRGGPGREDWHHRGPGYAQGRDEHWRREHWHRGPWGRPGYDRPMPPPWGYSPPPPPVVYGPPLPGPGLGLFFNFR
ncbi:MAG: hypothetical protein KGI51_06815 [Rhodospirillales bacterium]|nr:hypothetical protein [Rhodospirillales bacterium]